MKSGRKPVPPPWNLFKLIKYSGLGACFYFSLPSPLTQQFGYKIMRGPQTMNAHKNNNWNWKWKQFSWHMSWRKNCPRSLSPAKGSLRKKSLVVS